MRARGREVLMQRQHCFTRLWALAVSMLSKIGPTKFIRRAAALPAAVTKEIRNKSRPITAVRIRLIRRWWNQQCLWETRAHMKPLTISVTRKRRGAERKPWTCSFAWPPSCGKEVGEKGSKASQHINHKHYVGRFSPTSLKPVELMPHKPGHPRCGSKEPATPKSEKKRCALHKGRRRHKEKGATLTWAKINSTTCLKGPLFWYHVWVLITAARSPGETIPCTASANYSSLQLWLVQERQKVNAIWPIIHWGEQGKQTKILWTCRCQHKHKRLIILFSYCGTVPGEIREWERFSQQLLAGGQYTAQRSPQTPMWRQSHRVPALRFVFPFFYLQWRLCWQPHGKRQLYFCQWLQHILWNPVSQSLKSQVREFEAEHTEENVEEVNTLWTCYIDCKAPKPFYSLNFLTWAQFSLLRCAGEHTHTPQDCSCSGAEHQCRQEQGLIQNTSFETCCYQVELWEWNNRDCREASFWCSWWNEVLLPTETLPVFCCSNTIIIPPSAVLLCPCQPRGCFLCCIWSRIATQSTGIAPARPQ